MENKQTAVEWLVEQLATKIGTSFHAITFYHDNDELIKQAKSMEKEQIINAFENGEDNIDSDGCYIDNDGAKQYYNETYGN